MSILTELSDEQLGALFNENQPSCDIEEALINRITRLENLVRLQGKYIDALYSKIYQQKG